MQYSTNNSGRLCQPVHVELSVALRPGSFTVRVEGRNARSIHELTNRRLNYQSRDSPVDLLARDKWRSWWFDRFAGVATLQVPKIRGVPTELNSALIARWGPAFAVVEFQLYDAFYQLACRPRRGVSVWSRVRFTSEGNTSTEDEIRDSPNEPASSSTQLPPEEEHPV